MSDDILELIDDLEEYIDGCKTSAFSSNKIIVNRDDIESIISELKSKIPSELSRSLKIINNQQAIIDEAKRQAAEIINSAKIRTNELVSEHQIMQEAYAQANEVVLIATKDAQKTIDSATQDANEIRSSAIAYTDNLLKEIQSVLSNSIQTTKSTQDNFIKTMQSYLDVVNENRIQLAPNPIADEIMHSTPEQINKMADETAVKSEQEDVEADTPEEVSDNSTENNSVNNTGVIDIPEEFFKKD